MNDSTGFHRRRIRYMVLLTECTNELYLVY